MEGREQGFRAPPPALPAAVRERESWRGRRPLAERATAPPHRLADASARSADSRSRAHAAARPGAAMAARRRATVIETCLAAAREGLLTLRWDLICPRCRGAKVVATSLDQLPRGAHCPSCNIAFERDFSRNVEVTFDPAADIRADSAPAPFAWRARSPAEHIKVQRRLAAGAAAAIDGRSAGRRLPRPHRRARRRRRFRGRRTARVPEIALTDGDPVLGAGEQPRPPAARATARRRRAPWSSRTGAGPATR